MHWAFFYETDTREYSEKTIASGWSRHQLAGSRERMKRIFGLFMIGVMLVSMTACAKNSAGDLPGHTTISIDKKEESIELFAMDTYMTISAYGNQAKCALQAAETRIRQLERLWSVTDPESELYMLNHSGGVPVEVDRVTAKAVSFALAIADRTGGALDPTIYPVLTSWGFTTSSYQIPSQDELDTLLRLIGYEKVLLEGHEVTLPDGVQMDLGSVAKGYTADIVTSILKDHGITSALIDLGGNIQTVGYKPDGSKWRVGIKDAYGDGNIGVLMVADCAVVSSGGYERYFIGDDGQTYWHIIDPSTGKPADSGLVSATVVCKEGRLGDALSTALFVMGLQDAETHWRENSDFEMILMTQDNELYITEGLEADFALNQSHEGMPVHVLRR